MNPDTEGSGCGTLFFKPGNLKVLVCRPSLAKVVGMKDAVNAGGRASFRHGIRRILLGALLAIGPMQHLDAGTLFRWTDSDGRMHFGDRAPPADVDQVEKLELPVFAAPSLPPDQDPYSILNQLDRLQTNRQNLERQRQERAWQEREYYLRKRELQALEQAADRPSSGPVYGYQRPVYPGYPIHRPGLPGHRPGRPGQRPPGRPELWPQPDHPAFRPSPYPPSAMPRPPGRGASIGLKR